MGRDKSERSNLLLDPERGHKECCNGEAFYDTWIRPLIAEFVGVMLFVLIGTMSQVTANLLTIGTAHGIIFVVMAVSLVTISGAQLNPGLTLGVALAGLMNPFMAFLYIIFQLAGAIAGAAILRGLLDQGSYLIILGGSPMVSGTGTLAEALGLELILSFVIVTVYLVTQADHMSGVAPFAHGLVYFVGVIIAFPISGGVLNMARSFGPSVIYSIDSTDHWLEQWIYYVAGGGGAVLAVIVYKLVLATHEHRWNCLEIKNQLQEAGHRTKKR